MFDWIRRLRRRDPNEHEPEVEQSQTEQRRRFDAWESTMDEVRRVQELAETAHSGLHRPRPRQRPR